MHAERSQNGETGQENPRAHSAADFLVALDNMPELPHHIQADMKKPSLIIDFIEYNELADLVRYARAQKSPRGARPALALESTCDAEPHGREPVQRQDGSRYRQDLPGQREGTDQARPNQHPTGAHDDLRVTEGDTRSSNSRSASPRGARETGSEICRAAPRSRGVNMEESSSGAAGQ
ncbi:unnamed protein product [Prorocentrum cordatum]|uniref:Uncharacterized protein n=1 Tax=Prorocentrum cordatum TaxID=2364126 RepID=A0ABN9P676_9DINO|nr:unnamed protein product [Polarella glacialis]